MTPAILLTLSIAADSLKPTIHQEVATAPGYTMNVAWPEFPKAHPLAETLNKLTPSAPRAAQAEFRKAVQSMEQRPNAPWELNIKPVVAYNTPKLVSILYNHFEYAGGAHPNTLTHVVNVAMIDGKPKQITLTDIAVDGAAPRILEMVYLRLTSVRMDRVSEEAAALPPETISKFIVGKGALTFIFDPYAVGAYVEGSYVIKLSYRDLAGYLRRDLIPEALP